LEALLLERVPQRLEEGLVLLRDPTLTRRQRASRGYDVTSRISTPRRSTESNTAFGSASCSSNRMKLACDGYGFTPGTR
jgi:hypothetical protein